MALAERDPIQIGAVQMLTFESVSKSFILRGHDTLHVVDDLSLQVDEGEVLGVIGPSGCGKTTLLRMLAGLERPSQGHIRVGGRIIRGPGPERATVFQDFALLPWATVWDNIRFGLEPLKLPKAIRAERIRREIDRVGLAGFESSYPKELSGGMKQRVGLARALAVEPQVLLLDEPFAALDAQTKRLLQDDLSGNLRAAGCTTVLITHDMAEAVFLCDRIVVLSNRPARVAQEVVIEHPQPRPDEFRRAPEFGQLVDAIWQELKQHVRFA